MSNKKGYGNRMQAALMLALVVIFAVFITGCSGSDEADLDNQAASIPSNIILDEADKSASSELASDSESPSDVAGTSEDSSTFDTANNASKETTPLETDLHPIETPAETAGTTYILNTNTLKFHFATCPSVSQMKESNKSEYTGTRDEVIGMGYSSCGRCRP